MSGYVYRSAEQRRVGRIFRDLVSARELLRDIVWRELRARYRYATLGFLWTLLEPLAMMLVLTFVFTKIFPDARVTGASGEQTYAVVLLCGLIFWQYLSTALTAATDSLINNQNLVTKVYFTREVIPIAAVIYPLVNLGIGILLLMGVHAICDGTFGLGLLWLPVVFVIQFALVLGLGLVLSCGQVLYRDVGHLVAVGLTFGFYATPVFYELGLVRQLSFRPDWAVALATRFNLEQDWLGTLAKQLYMLNPMAELVTAYRQVLFELRFPDAGLLVWPGVTALTALVMGVVLFRRTAPTLSDHL